MRYLTVILSAMFIAGNASAWGEIFPLKIRGWEYCTDGTATRLSARTAIPLWVRLDSGDMWSVSMSPGFPDDEFQTFPMFIDEIGASHKRNKYPFIGATLFEGAYLIASGELQLDTRRGGWKSVKATFNQLGVFYFDCWSAGKLTTGKRLN